jgi:hypothetical protein
MLPFATRLAVVAVLMGLPLSARAVQEEPMPDKKVKEVVNQFLAALAAKDVKKAVKLSNVPWLAEDGQIVKDKTEVEKSLTQWLKQQGGSRVEWEVLEATPYALARKEIKNEQDRKRIDRVLGKEDRLVMVMSK